MTSEFLIPDADTFPSFILTLYYIGEHVFEKSLVTLLDSHPYVVLVIILIAESPNNSNLIATMWLINGEGMSIMLFGTPFSPLGVPCRPAKIALFDSYPIGARLAIGMDSGFWVGNFGGLQDGVALLTNAQLFSNVGTPIDGLRPVVRIPIRNITFVSQ